MSVSDKITRLVSASNGIKTSIGNKGVTVPSGAGFEDFSELIDLIPSGSQVVVGEITLATSQNALTINNLGFEPKGAIIDSLVSGTTTLYFRHLRWNDNTILLYGQRYTDLSYKVDVSTTTDSITIQNVVTRETVTFPAGKISYTIWG